jgi:outer membrane protein assembly factor BamB
MRAPGPLVPLLVALASVSASADVTPASVTGLARVWGLDAKAGVTGGPIVRDGRVYVGTWDSSLYALDPVTGAQIWKITVGGAISGRVATLDDGGICYGTLSGEVGCVDGASGAVRWTTNLTDPAPGVIWSAPLPSGDRLFVGVAGLTDQPCTRGRLVALDLHDGHELWRFYTVPQKVCTTDTAVVCTVDGDCPNGGTCVTGVGGGVTATPAIDPTGTWVYMNTVGCYTFPSIGESDSMFKIEAATGNVIWRNRVNEPEQFGTCVDPINGDTGLDCGTDLDCTPGQTCTTKQAYHDFGFLNGPLRIEVPDGVGGMKTLIVSGSKNGTLYAFDEGTGTIAWKNVVRATPISPGFAGFGLFNGAIAYADGRVFAALGSLAPARVCSNDAHRGCTSDGDCDPGATCPVEPEHLMAFDATTGGTVWEDEIGRSWSHVAVANGVVYAGTNATDDTGMASWLYAYDAASGQRLATFPLPLSSAARAAIDGNSVYVGYGLGGGGGIVTFSSCGNGALDPGESCDPAAPGQCCSPACTPATGGACDDADECTANDQCDAGACAGTITTVDQLHCSLDQLSTMPCGAEALPKGFAAAFARGLTRVGHALDGILKLQQSKQTARIEKLRRRATRTLDGLAAQAAKAAASHKQKRHISSACRDTLTADLASRHDLIAGFAF